jgi:hypothetical protein
MGEAFRGTTRGSYRRAKAAATTTRPRRVKAATTTSGMRLGGGIAERFGPLRPPDPPDLEAGQEHGGHDDQRHARERAVQPEDEEAEQRHPVLDATERARGRDVPALYGVRVVALRHDVCRPVHDPELPDAVGDELARALRVGERDDVADADVRRADPASPTPSAGSIDPDMTVSERPPKTDGATTTAKAPSTAPRAIETAATRTSRSDRITGSAPPR